MPDNQLLALTDWFPKSMWPALPCGACAIGHLRPSDLLTIDESERYRDHPEWEPDWVRGYFTARGTCTNSGCGHPAALAGQMQLERATDGHYWDGASWEEHLKLGYVDPPLRILRVPDRCPLPVKDTIASASRVLWVDPASAANRLRSAVEQLLSSLGVRKLDSSRKRLSAHQRIVILGDKRPEAATALEAVKWIGNVGSHTQELSVRDVVQGISLLEHALTLLYDTSAQERARLAKQVIKRRGRPVR